MANVRNVRGILVLDKPSEISSHRATSIVKRLYRAAKAGHGGTLDPLATGVLPIFLGEATKMANYLLEADKTYLVKAKMGIQTDTGDALGQCLKTSERSVSLEELQKTIGSFIGKQNQLPPIYSAVKVQGKPLYEFARKGIEVERKSRDIEIYAITIEDFQFPDLTLQVSASKGVYIRTLIDDLGSQLGCFAHVTALRRLCSGMFQKMVTIEDLQSAFEDSGWEGLDALLLPEHTPVETFHKVEIQGQDVDRLYQGQSLRGYAKGFETLTVQLFEKTRFLGIGELKSGILMPKRLLHLDQ